ncbi:MAG: hypothetical protein ACUVT1_09425 [Anaerolineae bacterium]
MTNRRLIVMISVLAVMALTSLVLVGTAFAQAPTPAPSTPTAPAPFWGKGWGRGFGFGCWGGNWTVFDAVAEALNMTPTQLFEQLHNGKTLEEIAEAQGVDITKVQEAAQAARVQAMKDAINQAVQDGRISQEEADWLLEGLEKGYLPGRWGRGGFGRGMGGLGLGTNPTTTPSRLRLHSFSGTGLSL